MSSKKKTAKATARRNAALKAWETRRSDQKKRSDAAKKAARTRAKNKKK